MPYAIETHMEKGKKCFSVVNTETGRVHSKCATESKAKRQMRLLEGIENKTLKKPVGTPTSWKSYYAQAIKGKKFGSRQEVNDFMKETAAKYRESKK